MHAASSSKGNRRVLLSFFLLGFTDWSLSGAQQVHFIPHTIATGLRGGYQVVVADLNHDGKPDLIALASGMPELVWFENPGWQRHVIASNFTQMINCVVLDSKSTPSIVLASGFSDNARNSAGNVWLLEPGPDLLGPWKVQEIDRLPTSHRLRVANIDDTGKPVVMPTPDCVVQRGSPVQATERQPLDARGD